MDRLSMKLAGVVMATALSLMAGSAMAAPTGKAPAAAAPPVEQAQAPTPRPTRYCVLTTPTTGSRIGGKICQTRDKWLAEGFDPLDPKR